jgi:hypothetical protein
LPPYLIVQLKRFDFSIAKRARTKLDQTYEFEDKLDLRGFIDNAATETRYFLKGVVVHQGEADVGHYLSYVREEDSDSWICLNDTGIQRVTTDVMRKDANGTPEGSSAYLLFYECANAKSFELPEALGPVDETGKAEIQNDNHRLAIDAVYLSPAFAEFVLTLMSSYGIGPVHFRYFTEVLMHSTLTREFLKFIDQFLTPNNLGFTTERVSDSADLIVTVMTECTNAEIRRGLADLVKKVIATVGPQADIILVLFLDVHDILPRVLQGWRKSLDFFMLVYDCASLGPEFCAILKEAELGKTLTRFVIEMIPEYVADKSNHITAERFSRRVDLTYLLKVLPLIGADSDALLSRSGAKWLVGSEVHARAFIEMYQQMRPNSSTLLVKLIEDCATPPSEFLIVEIMRLETGTIPFTWKDRYFPDAANQKHLWRAILEEVVRDPSFLAPLMDRHRRIFQVFLYASSAEIGADVVSTLRKYGPALPDFPKLLFGQLKEVQALSWTMAPEMHHMVLKPESFRGLPFLQLLLETAAKLDDLSSYHETVRECLTYLGGLSVKRDEHAIAIAQIGCLMMIRSVPVRAEFVQFIQVIFSKMLPEHPQMDSALRSYLAGVATTTLSFTVKLPENDFKSVLFKALLSVDGSFPTAKPLVIDFFKNAGGKYAEGSRILRFLPAEVAKYELIDGRALIETVAPYTNVSGVLSTHAPTIGKQPKAFGQFIDALWSFRTDEPVFEDGIAFVATLIQLSVAYLPAVLTNNARVVRPFVSTIINPTLSLPTRIIALKTLKALVTAAPLAMAEICTDNVIAEAFSGPEMDEFVAQLIRLAASGEFPAAKAGVELVGLARSATSLSDFTAVARAIEGAGQDRLCPEIIDAAREARVLLRLLEIPDARDVGGLRGLAVKILAKERDPAVRTELRNAARASTGPFHKLIAALLAGA